MTNSLTILGIMSGTSLDGIDFALCRFYENKKAYEFEILDTGYFKYSKSMRVKLSNASNLNTLEFLCFHKSYGTFIGKHVNKFLYGKKKPDYIASHGHTVFHDPTKKLTFQIGDGAFIAAKTKIPTISDFRNLDTALLGQGAPLVPIGDKLLFDKFTGCINLGGFANISFDSNNKRIAFDICPVNIILNKLSQKKGFDFDKNGTFGKMGNINFELLDALNNIPYYNLQYPKSLSREYVENYHQKVMDNFKIGIENQIRTYYRHIADQIGQTVNSLGKSNILITGGGTFNSFLIAEIKSEIKKIHKLEIPDPVLINYKEAIIFAFLGYLRALNKKNVLKSVTGAKINHSGGSIFLI